VAQGASNFTMSNLPHDYANMVYNVMAMQYWQSRFQGHYYDPATRTQVQASGPVKTHFAEVARIYAQRHRATGAAATAVITEQMQEAIAQSNWEPALRDLVQLRENAPNDPALRGDWAQALLGAGNALQAREEFTRTLCVMPLWAQGYLGRAQAHLMLGDNPRAQADLEVAASLGAGTLDDLRQRLSGFAAPPAPAEAVGQFEAEAQADADFVKIVDDALAVHRLSNAQRQRYDEAYQLRIRVLSEAMRDHAQSAD
jgi:tetratricopeptide (TPR) repeat protein